MVFQTRIESCTTIKAPIESVERDIEHFCEHYAHTCSNSSVERDIEKLVRPSTS